MISTYIAKSQHTLRRWALDPGVHQLAKGVAHVLAGFCLSAASLENGMLPLVLGLVWACRGWQAALVATGGALGYGIFWGAGSLQGLIWTGLSLIGVLILGEKRISREMPLLIPALGMLTVSGAGLGFQLLAADTTPIGLYLIRVALGGAAPWVFSRWLQKKTPMLEWLCWGLFALGLAQIAPVRWLGLGFAAAGFAAAGCALPCSAIVGLALDMAGITPVPMTAVAVLSFLFRCLPRYPRWLGQLAPGFVGLFLMYVCNRWDLLVLPGLFLGGIAAGCSVRGKPFALRRGQTGAAQVKLEMAAEVLNRTKQILEDIPDRALDTDCLIQRAADEACAGCSARDRCRDSRKLCQIPGSLLQNPLLTVDELPVRCSNGSRVLTQLRRAQEQLRTLQADRQRQQEYRVALVQQYGFLEDFLHRLSDGLARKTVAGTAAYDPLVFVYGNRSSGLNGDRCMEFAGVGNTYYILLCDGMGTGPGAVQEGKTAGGILRKLLSCGFPAENALRSLNSLCALRDRAGAVTVDLAEILLDTGKVTLYKWGGAPSYLLGSEGAVKLGSVSPPPGLSVAGGAEVRCSFTLRKGQTLLLVSDGVEETQIQENSKQPLPPAAMAENLLKASGLEDDATIVTIQLIPAKQ